MSFIEVNIKAEYRSLDDNVVKDFYLPLLEQAVLYKRAVGFFSSTALIEMSKGITGLIKNDGKIKLIASPLLSEEDVEAINKGYELREEIFNRAIENAIKPPKNIYEEKRLNLLANLIANGQLDIKIAFTEANNRFGIFHEKMGLMYDIENNIVAFSGSMNETITAFSHNYESFDVFCSWTKDRERVYKKERAFAAIWNDYEPNIRSLDFPQVAIEKFRTYKKSEIDLNIDRDEFFKKITNMPIELMKVKEIGPRLPEGLHLHDYQIEAVVEWERKQFVGIFDMATGTGKTYAGLAAITRLFDFLDGCLAVFIVCPFQHLVEQWVDDITKFNMRPIIGYSSSSQRNWKERLETAVASFNFKDIKHFCFVSTNATFSSEFVQEIVNQIEGNVILLIDEAHNFGADHLSKTLNYKIPYRLALSATIERHGDEAGTEKLFNYFGNKCIEYSLEMAIKNNKLSPYYYYPIVVSLNDDELLEYKNITLQINKHMSKDSRGKSHISEIGKMLLIKRARIVAAASEKLIRLEEEMEKYINNSHILVYCGAATLRDPGYKEALVDEEEKRQIDIVSNILGNKLGMRISKFTSEESASERAELKAAFAEGLQMQVLVAIRCLDEGVNIPSIKTAFILASSTNPKEYIQRRGRVLRKFPNKKYAVIYDFITLPMTLEAAENSTEGELNIGRSLVEKEITRMKDFASISENPAIVDQLISDICLTYKLNIIRED